MEAKKPAIWIRWVIGIATAIVIVGAILICKGLKSYYQEVLNFNLCMAATHGSEGHSEALQLLKKGANPNAACRTEVGGEDSSSKRLARTLKSIMGIKSELVQVEVYPAMVLAWQWENREVANLLLESGANPNSSGSDGAPPISFAVYYGRPEDVQALINKGADVNRADWDKVTPLIFALANKRIEMVPILIEAGADVSAVDKQEEAWLLIKAGANVHLKSGDGGSALYWARHFKQQKLIQLLKQAAAREK